MDAYLLWRAAPVPQSGSLEESADIRVGLMVADHYVSTVVPFVQRGVFQPAVPDVLEFLDRLVERIDKLIEEADSETVEIARYQHAYAMLQRTVYSQFLELGSGQG
ncbi:hypothetical protein [Kutzneria sp. NPDC052558]|uniref:hypothetical protein n=1 Tax=Kutzneria sp. NPDC052558 TaxID=3364121 RepID=UPI0037C7CA49